MIVIYVSMYFICGKLREGILFLNENVIVMLSIVLLLINIKLLLFKFLNFLEIIGGFI